MERSLCIWSLYFKKKVTRNLVVHLLHNKIKRRFSCQVNQQNATSSWPEGTIEHANVIQEPLKATIAIFGDLFLRNYLS
jgi:hypothetical protein